MIKTACKSRYYFDNVAIKKYKEKEYCIVYVDIDNLKQINDTRGMANQTAQAGDRYRALRYQLC